MTRTPISNLAPPATGIHGAAAGTAGSVRRRLGEPAHHEGAEAWPSWSIGGIAQTEEMLELLGVAQRGRDVEAHPHQEIKPRLSAQCRRKSTRRSLCDRARVSKWWLLAAPSARGDRPSFWDRESGGGWNLRCDRHCSLNFCPCWDPLPCRARARAFMLVLMARCEPTTSGRTR